MNVERWERVGALFEEVAELSPEQRAAHLDRLCGDDASLRVEVESLLDARERAGTGFLDRLDDDRIVGLVEEDSAPPDRIEPWRILGEIGRGGMGVVYEAVRDDGQFEQAAALKVIKRGMDTDAIVERFLRERQILARMEHPGIARLLDGGVTKGGRPWFALERVDGVPLTTYCDERKLGVEERLHLFCEVMEAVQYAHRNLVIHRDLKPPNVLVDVDDRVKLLDFGIAKLLDTEDGPENDATVAKQRWVTPGYGAPEQAAGGAITTATDVYSLGVLLYELLVGQRPDVEAATKPLASKLLGTLPSRIDPAIAARRGLGAKALSRLLAGDLETILGKAMQVEANRRYPSVEAFRGDVRRYLERQPILARPDSFGYRATKFLHRHRGGVVAAGFVLCALVAGLTAALWQAGVAARERDVARQESEQADQVKRFILDLFRGSDPNVPVPAQMSAQELLDRGLERVRNDLSDRPDLEMELMVAVGDISLNLGDFESAEALFSEALELPTKQDARDQLRVATVLNKLGSVAFYVDDFDRAEQYQRRALEIQRRWSKPGSLELAHGFNELGVAIARKRRLEEAIDLYLEALEIYEEAGVENLETLDTLYNLGIARRKQGDYPEAQRILREVLDRARSLDRHSPEMVGYLDGLGVVEGRMGRWIEAEDLLRQSVELATEIWGEAHPDTRVRMNNYAMSANDLGLSSVAEETMRKVLRYDIEQFGPEHRFVAVSRTNLARTLVQGGHLDEALQEFEIADVIHRQASSVDGLAAHLERVVWGWLAAGDLERARTAAEEALSASSEGLEPDRRARILTTAAYVRAELGLDESAEPLFREALEIHQQREIQRHPDAALAHIGLAQIETRRGDLTSAEARLETTLEMLSEALPETHVRTIATRAALAECWARSGRVAEGIGLLRRAIADLERSVGEEHWRTLALRAQLERLLDRTLDG